MMVSSQELLSAEILIVDDQEAHAQLLERLLRDAGYGHVTSTTDSSRVCALHRDKRYDLILLDLQMPGMDGFGVMEALQAENDDSYLPVVALTAQPGHKLRALEAGAKDFISKPFDLVEVKTRIHNMLEVRLLYKKLASHNLELARSLPASPSLTLPSAASMPGARRGSFVSVVNRCSIQAAASWAFAASVSKSRQAVSAPHAARAYFAAGEGAAADAAGTGGTGLASRVTSSR